MAIGIENTYLNHSSITNVNSSISKNEEKIDYQQIIKDKKDEIYEKIINGDTEPSYQIGGSTFTEKEWEQLLVDVDDATEELRQAMREEYKKRYEEQVDNRKTQAQEMYDALRWSR